MALALLVLHLILLVVPPIALLYVIGYGIGTIVVSIRGSEEDSYEWKTWQVFLLSLGVFLVLVIPQFFLYDVPKLEGFAPWVNMFNGKDNWGNE